MAALSRIRSRRRGEYEVLQPLWICFNSGRAAWCKASVETVQVLFFEGHLALRLARVDRLDPKLLMFLWITGFAPAFFIIAVSLAL